MTAARRLIGELLGTALLLAAVVGSGIMGDRLSGGNVAIALLANTLATGATLVTLIFTFGAVSGAHLNPRMEKNSILLKTRVFGRSVSVARDNVNGAM